VCLCLQAADPAAGLRSRYVLPEQLTPHHVHALLSDLCASAAQVCSYTKTGFEVSMHSCCEQDFVVRIFCAVYSVGPSWCVAMEIPLTPASQHCTVSQHVASCT
jgi:hypothetical protein